jgi:hypothetical protein
MPMEYRVYPFPSRPLVSNGTYCLSRVRFLPWLAARQLSTSSCAGMPLKELWAWALHEIIIQPSPILACPKSMPHPLILCTGWITCALFRPMHEGASPLACGACSSTISR